jgi:hypothetical protein
LGKKGKCVQCGKEIVFPKTLTLPAKEAAAMPEKPVPPPPRAAGQGLPPWLKWAGLAAVLAIVAGVFLFLALGLRGTPKALVVGKVTYNQKALSSGSITFFGENGIVQAGIGKDGSYEAKDCPVGQVKVSVRNQSTSLQKQKGDKIKLVSKSLIPAKYGDPERSGLQYNIGPGRQEIYIDLED